MATNKDKLLESAQKNLKKKQFSKAIKDYAKIVELDPADIRSRQKLAELYVRTKKITEAYEQYEAVAKHFSINGFYLKAIAIYKQMQRLDPEQIAIFNRLAEMNEKQGLLGNALSEYRNLVDYYGRNGMVADEIKTLEKMRDLDLNNLNTRVKLAEVYARNDRKDDGYIELSSVLEILSEKGAFDKILRLYKMFLPFYPDNNDLQMGLALAFYEKGDFSRGVTILEKLLKDKPADPDLLRLLGQGYFDLKDWEISCKTYQQLLDMDPTDLDIRESMVRCEINSAQYDRALETLEEWKDVFSKADRLDCLKEFYEILKEKLVDNSTVLQTLDSIYELTGDGDKLLDLITEQEDKPDEIFEETLSDSLLGIIDEEIDDSVADSEPTDENSDSSINIVEEESVDLQLESSLESSFSAETAENDSVIELEIDDSLELDQARNNDQELSFKLEDENSEETPPAVEHNLQADLEEAEFYIQQGLYVEAEKLCRDILAYDSNSIECAQKLEEIEALLNQDQVPPTVEQESSASSPGFDDLADGDFDFDSIRTDETVEKKVFKTDVDEQIAADDMESHYNLGIAYREMGLLDDAISEFEKAESESSRYVDCLTLKGLCFSDKNNYENAELIFQQALDSPQLEEIQRLSLGYELGLLYERAGRSSDALISYQDVFSQDHNYRDVKDKISSLKDTLDVVDDDFQVAVEDKKERISFL